MTVTSLAKRRSAAGEDPAMLQEYMGPLLRFLCEPGITEVVVNRPGEIWTENAQGWTRHDESAATFEWAMRLALLIANFNGAAIGPDHPILSATLIYGERVQVVIPPACEAETVSITIRKPSAVDKTLEELDKEGAFKLWRAAQPGLSSTDEALLRLHERGQVAEFLTLAVEQQRTILVVGKTGSGKTTVTRSLLRHVPQHERLITIEDTHELFLHHHQNKVHLFYGRESESHGRVTAKVALESCLRMRPDRILLAELRGDEAWEFIKLVNTGHPGSISTMHANGALDAFVQLTSLIKDSRTGAHLDAPYIRDLLFSTIDIVLFYQARQLREIYFDPLRKTAAAR